MTERELTTLREILGRIARRAEHKPDLELIKRLAIEADELVKNCSIADVVERSEQLKSLLKKVVHEFDNGDVAWQTRDEIENELKNF